MKNLSLSVFSSLAFCAVWAADVTYTWPEVGDELTVAYDAEDATKVKTILVDVAKGDTVTIIGGTIPLAENPSIIVTGGTLVFSNALDGTGTIICQPQTDESTVSWSNDTTYLQTEPDWTLIFPGKKLDEWEPVTSQGPADGHNPNLFKIYNVTRYVSNEVAYADFQAHYGYTSSSKYAIKCIWGKLKQTEAGIAAIIERCGAFTRFEESIEGEDVGYYAEHAGFWYKDYPRALMTQSVSSGGSKGYGINQLTMKRISGFPALRFEGVVTNSADGVYMPVSAAAGMAVTAGAASGINRLPAGSSVANAGVFTVGGAFTADDDGSVVTNTAVITNSGTFRYERTADEKTPGFYTDGFLATNTWQIVAQWCTLSDITNLIGKMTGSYIGASSKDSVSSLYHYRIAESGLVATGQVQFAQGTILRCLIVEFKQLGDHVGAKGLWVWSPTASLGTDTLAIAKAPTKYTVATDASKIAYNVHEFTVYTKVCRFEAVGLSATNDLSFAEGSAIEIAGSDAGRMQVAFCRTNSLPENGTVDVFAGGDMVLDPQPAIGNLEANAYVGGTCRIRVHEGGTLYQWGPWTPGPDQVIELRGGTLNSGNPGNTTTVGKEFINRLYLYDGAMVTGLQFRIGHTPSENVGWWKVRGTSPSHCYNIVHTESGANNARRTFKWDVWDVTGNDEADLVMHGPVRRYVSDWAHTNIVMRKTGAGTILFEQPCGANYEPMGPIDLEDGTWLLGANDTVGPKTEFRLKGGTLGAAAGTTNVMGPLTINAAGGAISLGAGATLTFADSSRVPWTATEKVTVHGFAEKAIRFGEAQAAAPNPRMFKMEDGSPLRVDKDGYLTAIPVGAILVVQ